MARLSVEEEEEKRTAVAVKVAATAMVDTVASGFRGRYSSGGAPATPERNLTVPRQTMTQSQTALIMQSRAATHMQSILDSLEPHEYVMLLGNGMLGVNLKQTYLKHHGVYMDYLVEGGAASMSGVVSVGDNLVKVGDVHVRRGLIANVPQTISAAKRPCVLVFSTGQQVSVERMNYVDVAVGMMHHLRGEANSRRDISSLPLKDHGEQEEGEVAAPEQTESVSDPETPVVPEEVNENMPGTNINVTVPTPSFDNPNPMQAATPPLAIRELIAPHVAKRYVPTCLC